MRSWVFCAVLPLAWACGHHDVHDSEATDDTTPADDSAAFEGCYDLYIDYDGPTSPTVGDQWDLQLWCDEALMTVVVIQFDPPEFASVDGRTATFLQAGKGTLKMQSGSQRDYLDITVGN